MKLFLGIDIGASGFKYGIGDSKHGLQHFATKRIGEKSMDAFRRIAQEILDEAEAWDILGIGIGSPGTISQPEGRILGKNPNLPFFSDLCPGDLIPGHLDLPVFVENDANLMALAESALRDCKLCVGITVGSGIGCGIVQNGDVFHGAHGFAAELGHSIVYPEGELCSCGQKGCVEAYSSVDGIRRRLHNMGSSYAGMALPNLIALRNRIPELDEVLLEGEDTLIRALANLCTVLDPDILILGGGAMDLNMYNATRIEEEVIKLLPEALAKQIRCCIAGYGNRAGVMGGIMLCERKLR
jgi:glucokinase